MRSDRKRGVLREMGYVRPGPEDAFNEGSLDRLPENYQWDMVRLLFRDKSFALSFSRHFDPWEHVESAHVQWSSHLCIRWWQRHQSPPTLQNVRDGIDTRYQRGEMDQAFAFGLTEFFEGTVATPLENDSTYIQEQSERWLKRQILLGIHRDAKELLKAGDDDGAQKCYDRASSIRFSTGGEEESYVEHTETAISRRAKREVERIPLGMGFDEVMKGGMDRQYLTVIGAPSDVGKTTVACYVACQAVEQGYKVAYVSIETPIAAIRDLMDSYFSQMRRDDLLYNPEEVRSAAKSVGENYGDALQIARWVPSTSTPADIRDWLHRLRSTEDFWPDLLIVESPDEMIPNDGFTGSTYQDANKLYLQIIAILCEFNCAGVVTSQTKGETYNQAIIRLNQLSDSLNKVRRGHVVIFLAQTDEMKSPHLEYPFVIGILAKQKNGSVNIVQPLIIDYARTRLHPVRYEDMKAQLGFGFQLLEQ